MRSTHKLLALLCAGLFLLLAACGAESSPSRYLDANGYAHWDPVENAVEYEAQLLDENGEYDSGFRPGAEETSAVVPDGYSLRIRPIFADGTAGDWMLFVPDPSLAETAAPESTEWSDDLSEDPETELYREVAEELAVGLERVLMEYKIYWNDLQDWEILSHIDRNSVNTGADGTVSFEATAPNGSVLRFAGTNIELTDEGLLLHPDSALYSLDAIGRIAAVRMTVTDGGSDDNWCWGGGGYTFSPATSVSSSEQLYIIPHLTVQSSLPDVSILCTNYQPNFIACGAEAMNTDTVTVSAVTVYYDEKTYNTGLRLAALDLDRYGTYLSGEYYDTTRESFKIDLDIYDFALSLFPDISDESLPYEVDVLLDDVIHPFPTVYDVEDDMYTIGALRDADGNVLNKETDPLTAGCTLDITIGDFTLPITLPVTDRYDGAQTLHELTPYNNATAQGEVLSLVIPISWQDQTELANDDMLYSIYAKLGRVVSPDGNVTDYSDSLTQSFSVSEYFDTASYGQYTVSSYVTDWYAAPYDFEQMREMAVANDTTFRDEVYSWLMQAYPDMDWSRFDADGDGFFDSVVFINAGDNGGEMIMAGYGYGLFVSFGYTGEGAGTPDRPTIKNFVSLNSDLLSDNTLIHELSHSFGLIDYYDVTYSGIDAVGHFDMQSDGFGDWNAYSKYAVGWIEPQIVSGLESGESVTCTLSSLAQTGDAIVIPAAGAQHDGPFSEYILLDLFTDDGLNLYDAAQYDLSGVVGVRISHVNANMEKRVLTGEDGTDYTIGTAHLANAYNENGLYQIEVIQAGGVNTFSDSESEHKWLSQEDLFLPGDVFEAEDYEQFLTNGRMDDKLEFGYTVEIVDIQQTDGDYSATIRVTRK